MQSNPAPAVESGEFVAKNLVLAAATLVLMSHTRPGAAAAISTDVIERSKAA